MASFEKDFRKLCRQINSLSDGQARASYNNVFNRSISISGSSPSSDSKEDTSKPAFFLEITPHDGPYAHGSFIFHIEASEDGDYPEYQPMVSCLTRIYHPNIDTSYGNYTNNVCVSTLSEWDGGPNSTLEDLLQGLLFLFYSPNPDDPLTSNITSDESEFLTNVRIAIEGGEIEDFDSESFDMNYGYERYLIEQEKLQVEDKEKLQADEKEELDDALLNILTTEPNFKQLFTADTLAFLMNTTSESSLPHSIRHNKESAANS